MRRQLVAGILVKESRILLIRKITSGTGLEGLWSLPMGAVGENESHDKALVRAFADTTGLDVCISRTLFIHERDKSETSLFNVSIVGNSLVHDGPPSHQYDFFAFDNLPEQILVDSLLCIVKYQLTHSTIGEHPFNIIDRVLASIFYSCLAPRLSCFDIIGGNAEIYKYIVLSTPYRKFKSVVPFLISRCNREASHLFLIPELCFAVWTLMDDCHDETFYRYGCETALHKFGKRPSTVALFTSLHDIKKLLDCTVSQSQANRIVAALVQSASVLLQRGRNNLDTDMETYLEQSAARTEFLRVAWMGVLEESGYDTEKREILYDIQKNSSKIGQLINDYFDIDRGLQDFDRKVASAHWLLLNRRANEDDRGFLRALLSRLEGGKELYLALLEKYDIKRGLSRMIGEALARIVNRIQQTTLDKDEKAVLSAWHHMSFVQFNPHVDDAKLVTPFLETVDSILYEY